MLKLTNSFECFKTLYKAKKKMNDKLSVKSIKQLESPFIHHEDISKFIQDIDFKWLLHAPSISVFRSVNIDSAHLLKVFNEQLPDFNVNIHKTFNSVVCVKHHNEIEELQNESYQHLVVIDYMCAAAVLRGADVFAPGILGMTSGKYYI